MKAADRVVVNGASGRRYVRGFLGYKGDVRIVPYATDSKFLVGFPAGVLSENCLKLL